jgi:hypothetical protein
MSSLAFAGLQSSVGVARSWLLTIEVLLLRCYVLTGRQLTCNFTPSCNSWHHWPTHFLSVAFTLPNSPHYYNLRMVRKEDTTSNTSSIIAAICLFSRYIAEGYVSVITLHYKDYCLLGSHRVVL